MGLTTGYKLSDGTDIGIPLVEKSYLIDRYPELVDTFRFAGLWTWGYNYYGELGTSPASSNKSSPVQTIAAGTNWKQVAAGSFHSAAIKTDGTLWLWGRNNYGHLGDNTIVPKSSPVQTISGGTNWKQVATGGSNSAAIKTDGTLWLWGRNSYGQLGDYSLINKSFPVQIITGGTNWKQVAFGASHAAAIKTDGTLWLWGYNYNGQLGDNTIVDRSSPVQTIAGGTNWKQVAIGSDGNHTAAIKTDGTLWTWGYNQFGQLGDNTRATKSSPIQTISGGTNWKYVAAGESYVMSIKTDGTLWGWGYNSTGELGDNTTNRRSSPVQNISGGTNWKQISCGHFYSAGIKTDGTLWVWGDNTYATLGIGTIGAQYTKSSPVQTISAGTNWKQISCGYRHTIALRDDSSDIFGNSI